MFNPHTEFEVSEITCNEEMKATPNVKILVLSHPLGDFEVTHYGSMESALSSILSTFIFKR